MRKWNLEDIRFLHPPHDFVGTFSNDKMQERHLAMQRQKILEIEQELAAAEDPAKAMLVLDKREHLRFLHNNIELFKEAYLFEKTVLRLFYYGNTPFAAAGKYEDWAELFRLCDKKRLAACGPDIPEGILSCFRGSVTGVAKGLSWTVDTSEVQWILNRWADKDEGGGTVFAAQIPREAILVYIEEGRKKEVIIDPDQAACVQPVVIESL